MSLERIIKELDGIDIQLKESLKNNSQRFPNTIHVMDSCGGCNGTQMECKRQSIDIKN